MSFHRFTIPSYTGGLPGGYDYINNATSGTPALIAPARNDGGPNNGTYLVGFGEDGRSIVVNRGLAALAQNTDFLDDLLRRDIAVCSITNTVTAGSSVSSITLTGPGIFLGASGVPNTASGINTFVEILDENDREIIDSNGARCMVVSLTGGTVGAGAFSTGNVVLTVTPAIPAGKQYRVYYGIRGNLATLPVDALTNIKIRSAEAVSAQLEGPGGAALIGYAGGAAWLDGEPNPARTVESQLDHLIDVLSANNGSGTLNGASKIGMKSKTWQVLHIDTGSVSDWLLQLFQYIDGDRMARELAYPYDSDVWTIGLEDSFIEINTTGASGPTNIALPDPGEATGKKFFLAWSGGDFSAHPARINPYGSDNIEGVNDPYDLSVNGGRWILQSDGTNWTVWNCSPPPTVVPDGVRTVTHASTSGDLTFLPTDSTVLFDVSGGNINFQLPNPNSVTGKKFFFAHKAGNLDTNGFQLFPFSSEKIDGSASTYEFLATGGRWILQSDGTDWYIWSC